MPSLRPVRFGRRARDRRLTGVYQPSRARAYVQRVVVQSSVASSSTDDDDDAGEAGRGALQFGSVRFGSVGSRRRVATTTTTIDRQTVLLITTRARHRTDRDRPRRARVVSTLFSRIHARTHSVELARSLETEPTTARSGSLNRQRATGARARSVRAASGDDDATVRRWRDASLERVDEDDWSAAAAEK